jgi:phage/conjugal plasmid C-4 type zinc finger TraR family protein
MTGQPLQVDDSNFMSNMAEEEFGQIHSIHLSMNAIGEVQKRLLEQANNPGLSHCENCGDEIPALRRKHVKGVRKCVLCQTESER